MVRFRVLGDFVVGFGFIKGCEFGEIKLLKVGGFGRVKLLKVCLSFSSFFGFVGLFVMVGVEVSRSWLG